MDLNQILEDFGLSDKEASVYLALLKLGQSTVKPIAELANVKRTSIYNFIDRLVSLGLITKTKINGRQHFVAAKPSKLLDIQHERSVRLEKALPLLSEIHESSVKSFNVNYYKGSGEVRNIVKEEITCKNLAKYIWPGMDVMDMIGGAEHMENVDRQRIANKVEIQAIRFRRKDITFSTSAHGRKYLRKMRYAPGYFDVSMGMAIYDTGKVGFFSSDKEDFGVLIESQELCKLMNYFFDLLWKDCIPAREGEG